MRTMLNFLLIFGMVFFVATAACFIVWEKFVDGNLYNCTDPALGYLSPDGWVGGGKWQVITVKKVVGGRSINEPDEIKEGWSVAGLWGAWNALFASSLLVSVLSAAALAPKRADRRRT
jgi:hypothetical protein